MPDYSVLFGDTLEDIAARVGTTPEELARINLISGPLQVGQRLKLPYSEETEMRQVLDAMSPPSTPQFTWPKLPPLSHEAITSGEAFKVPEAGTTVGRVLGAVKKGALGGIEPDRPIGPEESEVQRIQGLGPVTESVQDIARGFGRVTDVAGRAMNTAFGAGLGGFEQSLIEGGASETTAGQLTRDLALETTRRMGGFNPLAPKMKPVATAKHLLTTSKDTITRDVPRSVAKWLEESPNARDITPAPAEINLFSGATKIGKPLIKENVVDRPGAFFHKIVEELYQIGTDKLRVTYSLSDDKAGLVSQVDFSVNVGGKLGALKELGSSATSPRIGMDTISTVISSVENHIRKVRPNRVYFNAADDRLVPLYERFANQLAKEHDGVVTESSPLGYEVAFPRHVPSETHLSSIGDLTMLLTGAAAIASFPKVIKTIWPKVPLNTSRVLPAEFGPTNLRVYDRASDVRKAYHLSPWTGLFANLRRRGFDNKAHFDALEQNSNSALFSKIDAALAHGEMPGIDATYKSAIPAGRIYAMAKALPKAEYNLANEYLLLLDTLDVMNIKNATSGAGMTMAQIKQRISAIESLLPKVKDIQKDYEVAMMAAVEYQSAGRYSTIGKKKTKTITTSHRHLVPWEMDTVDASLGLKQRLQERALAFGGKEPDLFTRTLLERKLRLSELPRVDAFDMLIRSTEMALRERTLNGVKGKSVEAYVSTNANAIISVTEKDIKANPKWADRVFKVKEGGVDRRYISSSFISAVLRLDPHFAQNSLLWATNRAFQWGTTSYGAPWFALVQFVRENQLANVFGPSGMKGIGIPYVQSTLGVVSHWSRLTQRQFANEIYRNLDSGAGRVLRSAFAPVAAMRGVSTEAMMRSFADSMSKSYTNSLTYLYQQRGGAGSGMTRQHVQVAKSAIDEALRDVNIPHSLRVFGEFWKNGIDAFHSGGKYTFWVRNVKKARRKAGKNPISEDLLNLITRESRQLTGDLSVSGRFYPGAGKDIVNKNLLNSLELPFGGKLAEVARENTIWFNALVKGYEKLALDYWNNPLRFYARTGTSVFLPATASFFSAMYLGKEYVDYMLKQRSEYEKATRLYIPIPGRKPEEGIWLPWAIEFAPLQYAFTNFLAEVYAGAEEYASDWSEIGRVVMNNFAGLNLPPLFVSGVALTADTKIPSTIPGFGEEAYRPKENPYSFLPGNVELFLRSAWGGAMDPFLGMINTFSQEKDVMGAIEEAGYRTKQKMPVVGGGQLTSMHKIGQDFYDFIDKLKTMEQIYQDHYAHEGFIQAPMTSAKKPKPVDDDILTYGPGDKLIPDMVHGRTKTGKKSKKLVPSGEKEVLLPSIPKQRIGESPGSIKPTNPVYEQLAKGIHTHFKSNGNNWGRLMKRMSGITEHIKTLKNYNSASMDKAKTYIEALPDNSPMKAELMQFDWSKRDSVRKGINYLEKERMKGFQVSKLFVREVELRIKAQTGMDIKLEDLDPYGMPEVMHLGVGAP